jgi:hypothetical protein
MSEEQATPESTPAYLGIVPDPKQTFILLRRRCPTCKGLGYIHAPRPDTITQPQTVASDERATALGMSAGYGVYSPLPCPSCTKFDPTTNAQVPSNPWGQGWFDEQVTLEQLKEILSNG